MGNLITAARVLLLFVTVGFIYLSLPHQDAPGEPAWAIVAVALTLIVILGDAVDGVVARARGESGDTGAVVDIAGDRIVENVYWVVFAHIGLLSVWFPLVMLLRSFTVDALRSLALSKGKTAFGEKTMMQSGFGLWLAASRLHRALYGGAKVVTFIWLLFQLSIQVAPPGSDYARMFGPYLGAVQAAGIVLAVFTLLYSLLRGAVVVWDSREYFRI
ncbi:MAG TPA: CDP-alcohol phosphatidyltransferase family protein [Chloroflexia bacterium]|nr:CDP-alcohol phosphatidyltransferase family protein [Chloroflexia bacterium]